ncbi:MAG: DUF488 domain-containing protein [Lachnospiraceae bacterium]|nr:DUF488 domain-containing protein [Lachnospiraceae bacterium]
MLYTIGHTNHSHEAFLELLEKYKITYLLDVRSTPFSQFTSQFNKDVISKFLQSKNIKYFHMGKYFGARPEDKTLYTKDNYLDFEKMRASELFQKGMNNVIKGLKDGENIALMCTEKDPLDCHRAIMVARGFELNGIDINHILPDGSLQSQKELNDRLLDKYYPDRFQLSLISNISEIPEDELLIEAYRQRNREIGYHNENL